MTTVKLNEHNSITIPAELLEKLGLAPGDSLDVKEVDGGFIARPVRAAGSAGRSDGEYRKRADQFLFAASAGHDWQIGIGGQ